MTATVHFPNALPLIGLLLFLPAGLLRAQPAAPIAAPTSKDVLKLNVMKVRGSAVGSAETVGTDLTETYNAKDIEETGVFDLDEFFAQLPTSPAGGEQLVLIDGKPTYVDISKLPLELIESIEVSNQGALSQYGAYANGRVVNIRLKQNFRGDFIWGWVRGSFAGDGLNKSATYSSAMTYNKFRIFYGISYRKQDALMASDRPFSREQDHTTRGGRDLRLLWGEAAVVQALTGNLAGVLDAAGQPTAVALAPEDQDGRGLVPADFLPGQIFPPASVATAAGQRRFNTAEYVTLITPSEEKSATFNISRTYGKTEASLTGSVNQRHSVRSQAPPASAPSADTLVPAAYNPFGQDVQVGLVHTGFGPVRSTDRSTSGQLGLGLSGILSGSWRWNADLGGRWSRAKQQVGDLDRDALADALASPDPTQRFNPFGDDPINALLYPDLTVVRASMTESSSIRLDGFAQGNVGTLKGGPIRLTLRGDFNHQIRDKTYENPASPVTGEERRRDNNQGFNANLNLPWVGQKNPLRWARRLETTLGGGYSARSSIDGGTMNGRFDLRWTPLTTWTLGGSYDVTRHAPSRFLADATSLTGETLIDPLRSPATTTDVLVTEHDFDGAVRARSERLRLNTQIEPAFLPGLQITVSYDRQQRRDLTSSRFEAQDLIYNELTFSGRVTRAVPTEDDQRLGQPGRITSIDTTPSDRAAQESSGLSWEIRYRRKSERLGQVTVSTSVRHSLSRSYELVPGVPFVFESGNDLNPPDWTLQSRASWSRRGWRVSANFRYVDEVQSGGLLQPAVAQLSLQGGYRFTKPIWGKWGRGVQVSVSLTDLLQGEPPFADTINGYRTGSALGRSWALMVRMPLSARGPSRVMEGGGDED